MHWVYYWFFLRLIRRKYFLRLVDLKVSPLLKLLFMYITFWLLVKEKTSSQNLISRWLLGVALTVVGVVTIGGHYDWYRINWTVWPIPLVVLNYSYLWWDWQKCQFPCHFSSLLGTPLPYDTLQKIYIWGSYLRISSCETVLFESVDKACASSSI